MVHAKKLELMLFLSFIVFPFGQLFKIGSVSLLDILVALFVVISFFNTKIKIDRHLLALFFVFGFSLVFGGLYLKLNIATGFLYFGRLITYLLFAVFLRQFVFNYVDKEEIKKRLVNFIFVGLVAIAIFGWLQYFLYPDFRPFFAFGWDDHLYRLIGSFLDPGFTSIFLVFGALISLVSWKTTKNKWYLLSLVFFVVTLIFTYSRAGYLALLVSSVYLIIKDKAYSYVIYLFSFMSIVFLGLGIFSSFKVSEGTNLLRTYSITQRIISSQSGIKIFSNSPLFGIGYNNVCEYKNKYLGDTNTQSHACSGLDNSIVFVLATTGFFGLLSLIKLISLVYLNTADNWYGQIFSASGIALLVHSQFNNSIFYSFCLFVLGVMYAISRKKSLKLFRETDK
ncbi:MAG: O-antigen ligase family protein [Patescibacteria group bacterium]